MYTKIRLMYNARRRLSLSTVRHKHKHVVLDQSKLDRARRALNTRTDRETIERALDVVLTDKQLDALLRRVGGKTTLRKVFR